MHIQPHSGAQLGRGGGSLLFFEIKKAPDFGKGPDCVHLWVPNIVLRVSRGKKFHGVSLRNDFFLCFGRNIYRSILVPRSNLCLEKFLVENTQALFFLQNPLS